MRRRELFQSKTSDLISGTLDGSGFKSLIFLDVEELAQHRLRKRLTFEICAGNARVTWFLKLQRFSR